ncbi:MAG: ATP-dependent protease ATPase subunit HslU [Synergistetes bacterium]|nr:ATP-dependent protease ATPase subunit HslU [Synergistota bacterium]
MDREKELTPSRIVEELNKFIIGQDEAKKAVAIALRNRFRRRMLPPEKAKEIIPKNILMIGPTGVGKTEIARRLAMLVDSPFIKVEATKFTEVGYVGRDVESIIREIVASAVHMVKQRRLEEVKEKAEMLGEERLLDVLLPAPNKKKRPNYIVEFFGGDKSSEGEQDFSEEYKDSWESTRKKLRERLRRGELDDKIVEIEVTDKNVPRIEVFGPMGMDDIGMSMQDILGNILPPKVKRRKVTVAEAWKIFENEEAQKLIDMDEVINEAISKTEEEGIVFIDEIDKIVGRGEYKGPDVSREGVQRDILPIIEGSTVMTKYGPVRTEHILFIAAGAFHMSKPSDLIPELQGRFPIRVELKALSKEDLRKILVEPENSILKQYKMLLSTEGIDLEFTDDALDRVAEIAYTVNEELENIGARRLTTVMEKLLEEISFKASELRGRVVIDREYVDRQLSGLLDNKDLRDYIL